jgi:UDP-N-acetylglucosamine 4,6-dehydratase
LSDSRHKNSVLPTLPSPSEKRVYLITGGTGSLGTELTKVLLAQGHKVRALARSEHGHERLRAQIPQELHPQLSSLVGAVEDLQRLHLASRGADYVIHAAAQKAIPLAEYNPRECTLTNIVGTLNVIDACLNNGVKRAVFVSTDKASAPATLYGFTKATAERLWLGANHYSAGNEPHFAAVRYGNCWMSQGSVLHVWKKQAEKGSIEITDPTCTRFHLMLSQAVAFVLEALHAANPGELWVPKIPSYRLGDLAHAFRLAHKIEQQPVINGLRLSEKRHESMISEDESASLKCEEDLHYVLEPGAVHRKGGFTYNSGANEWKLNVESLRLLIEETK